MGLDHLAGALGVQKARIFATVAPLVVPIVLAGVGIYSAYLLGTMNRHPRLAPNIFAAV
jgi:hypothetical protein